MEGFKKFILRGNVVDLAIGVVIGAAFTAIITAIVTGLVNPLIGLFGLGTNLNEKVACIGTCSGTHGHRFLWGSVISAAITFVIIGCSLLLRRAARERTDGAVRYGTRPGEAVQGLPGMSVLDPCCRNAMRVLCGGGARLTWARRTGFDALRTFTMCAWGFAAMARRRAHSWRPSRSSAWRAPPAVRVAGWSAATRRSM